jgi:PAS domain S-box-containing protein
VKFTSIKSKLLIANSLFIIVLLAVIATGTYLYFRHTTRALIFEQQFALVTTSARNLDDTISSNHQRLISVSAHAPHEIIRNREAAQTWLDDRLALHAIFSGSLYILDNQGTMLASVPPKPELYGISLANRDYFSQTMSSGQPFISSPFMTVASKQPAITMTAPLKGADGAINGILCGRIDLLANGTLFASLKDVRLGSTGYLYLFAPDRTMIMHPDQSRIMKRDVKPGANKMFDRALAGFEGSGESVNSKGIHFLASFKRLKTTGWILAANYPSSEAYMPIIRFRNYYLLGMVIVLLGAIILIRRIGIGISSPLTAFTGSIQALTLPGADTNLRLDATRADELGLLGGAFNTLLDEVQLREQALKGSTDRYRKLFEESHQKENQIGLLLQTTDQGIYGTDENGCFTFINRAGLEILGYRSEELVGRNSHQIIHYKHADGSPYPADECPIQRANVARTSCRADDEVLIRKDGCHFSAEFSSYPVLENGQFRGGVVTFSDITGRKQDEEIRRKLSRAIEQSPVTTVITDMEGRIEFVNPIFTALTGYTAEEARGQNPRILKSGSTPPETYEKMWATILEGKTWEGEFLNKKKNGELFWEHAVISALRDETGAITHYLAVKENITEKKKMLEELTVARDRAESATRAKSSFLATMSHEIRTPMNGVIGMTSLLLDTEQTAEQREFTEIVRKSGESLLALINDILDFSKIEAGKMDLEILDFDLRLTLEDTAELLSLRAVEKKLELICRIDPAVPSYLRGDPGRLRQIITNLTGNAIKFTHQGEIVISATLVSEQPDAVTVLFEIHDTGIGIPPDRLEAVFAPFTQVDGSTTRKYGGTGLGLAICKQLTELMGGDIGVASEVGVGSTFRFTARFEKQPVPTGGGAAQELVMQADITGVRILVVDDNRTNRLLMTTLLNHWGCRHDEATDGCAGLEMLRSAAEAGDPFQLVLLDQEMPVMDGLEMGRRIKSDPQLAATPMIMVTSIGQRGDVTVLEQIGFAGYLAKPVRQSQLHDCIALALRRSAESAPQRKPHGIITRFTIAECADRGMRILLAEDNVINQKVAQHILKSLGYKADVVANGLEALRALELINYDLVLMDCLMPEMDGFAATALIRDPGSNVLNHAVPVIAMTANAMQGDRENCLKAGMDDYLSKPVKKDELSAMLTKWTKGGSADAEERQG